MLPPIQSARRIHLQPDGDRQLPACLRDAGSRWLNNYLLRSWSNPGYRSPFRSVGYYGQYQELYLIAILTALFRGLVLPYLIWRIIVD